MSGTALLYQPGAKEPEITALTAPPQLEYLQAAVGGFIEMAPGFNSIEHAGAVVPCVVFANEEGKLQRLEVNVPATMLWDLALRRLVDDDGKPLYRNGLLMPNGNPSDVLCGPILVLIGEPAFLDAL
jgi:hypothetical protein